VETGVLEEHVSSLFMLRWSEGALCYRYLARNFITRYTGMDELQACPFMKALNVSVTGKTWKCEKTALLGTIVYGKCQVRRRHRLRSL